MKKKQKILKRTVFFNASVVLAGINSPSGGSAKVLEYVKKGKIEGVVSEVVLDEVLRHAGKFDFSRNEVLKFCLGIFRWVVSEPDNCLVQKCCKIMTDDGDAHILASCREAKVGYLVTLDKKHLLILKGKIKGLKIFTPGELILLMNKKK